MGLRRCFELLTVNYCTACLGELLLKMFLLSRGAGHRDAPVTNGSPNSSVQLSVLPCPALTGGLTVKVHDTCKRLGLINGCSVYQQ